VIDRTRIRGAQGRPSTLNPVVSVVKRLGPLRHSKGPSKLSLPTSPTPCTSRQLQQQGIQKLYPQRAPRWLGVLLKLMVHRRNPLDGSKPPRVTKARDEVTQRVTSSWRIWCPIEGTRHSQASYLSPEREVSFTPFMWAGIEPSRFFARII
jgi:hypothetical protein